MPAPATADELLDLVQKSGVADEGKLKAHLQKLAAGSGVPKVPTKLAENLVREGLLTYFQAEQLLQGKWKRFTIGKYKVLEKLGSGGMGTVFLCEHKLMRRRVAVKVLPVPKSDDRSSLDRFFREAKAAAAVDHPNIVRAYDIDQDDNLHFLVMEYVDGTNLQDLVRKVGPLPFVRACHYVYGAAAGLQYAHEIGLVHRDIKPGNILIDRAGVVKLLDMGLARFFHDEDDQLTRQNDESVLGTADYLAPEQAMDSHTVDIRADIYSLGATFYYLLTGSPPYPEGSVAQKLIWHQSLGREPRPVRELRPDVPEELVAVVRKMMAKVPANRYQKPNEVMAALAPWVTTPIPPPAEQELPKLSPAIARAPSTMIATTPRSGPMPGAQPPLPADRTWDGTPAPPGLAAPPLPPPADATPAVWEELAFDTQTVAKSETARSGSKSAARSKSKSKTKLTPAAEGEPRRRKRWLVPALVGAILLVLGGGTWAFFHFRGKGDTPPTTQPGAAEARRLIVGKTGENAYPTLREALSKASPGDTIVIAAERVTEPPLGSAELGRARGVTIESDLPGGKAAVLEYAGPPGKTFFDLENVNNVRVRNVEFDGKGSAEIGVRVIGGAAGVVFEAVTVRNVRAIGFALDKAGGAPDRPLLLDRVRVVVTAGSTGVSVYAPSYAMTEFTKNVAIRNSRFEGPGKAGVLVEGPAANLDVRDNRFFRLDAGVAFGPPTVKPLQARVTGNTFAQVGNGLFFDRQPGGAKVEEQLKYDVTAGQNYFAQVKALAQVNGPAPVPGFTSQDNGFAAGSSQGNQPVQAVAITAPLPNPNPDDDATFLRFPAGPNKPKVGAQ